MISQACISLTKYFLFLFNLIFFCLGTLLLILGLWIVFEETSFFMPAPSSVSLSILSYFLAIGGTVTMAIGFFGCLGALKEVKCMLGMYFFILTILLAAQVVGGVLFFTQRTSLEENFGKQVLQIIDSVRKNETSQNNFEKTLFYVQREIQCCGWNGPHDWKSLVPCSCYQPANNSVVEPYQEFSNGSEIVCPCQSIFPTQNHTCIAYEQGCKAAFQGWLEDNMLFCLGILFAVVVVELSGMTLSMCLYRHINLDYSELTRYS
ncbi:hypothetical protein JZ751_026592 [Albula glossodonta]|uniref:Tetraspanin n=1 Tax=Albula glossodonta TaxID=121402 RepID=A0A8T2PKZ6_9TELE|nr:hypothetical protein JZ751_026592 [Albula glossodonta]